jgi:hypothetical protein
MVDDHQQQLLLTRMTQGQLCPIEMQVKEKKKKKKRKM